jgi:uncharacterized protein YjbJ (UPF0337 family)
MGRSHYFRQKVIRRQSFGGKEPRAKPCVFPVRLELRRRRMDREHVKGAADKVKGAVKEGAGKLTGDRDLEAEGKWDKAKGDAHRLAGDVKDAARDARDSVKDSDRR